MRLTHALVQLAVVLLRNPDGPHWGYELSRESGVGFGAMYSRLTKMLDEEWVTDGWESVQEAQGRPPRRYYRITEKGLRELTAVVSKAQQDARFQSMDLGWAR
jgi:PadR family transcriptional regulator PadR